MAAETLETYVPVPREIVVGGKTLAITPLRVRQIPAFTRAIAAAAPLLAVGRIIDVVALHGEDIIKAMSEVDLHPATISNLEMGYVFEHLVIVRIQRGKPQ